MNDAWKLVKDYSSANAKHITKGYALGEISVDEILERANEELQELREASYDPSEMADLMGCLIHVCVRRGWPPSLIERELRRKLALRFGELTTPTETTECQG